MLGTLPQRTRWWIIQCSCLFVLCRVEIWVRGPHAYSLYMANTISRKIRLHIMNEQWVHTYICTRLQSNTLAYTHTYTHIFVQGKLVLINLAGRTWHVFPFTSWPVPRAAQWKPSILVCLQFVYLNLLLIWIIHWWPVGLKQEVLSDGHCGIVFNIIYHVFFFSSFCQNGINQYGHQWKFVKSVDSLWIRALPRWETQMAKESSDKEMIIRVSHENCKGAYKASVTLWVWGGQMFFSHTFSLWAAYTTAYHPLDNFLFRPVSQRPKMLSRAKDAMPDYNKRSGLWCWYGEICYTLSQC